MQKSISERDLNVIISEELAQIARFALGGFRQSGRGAVAILPQSACEAEKPASGYLLRYLVYKPDRGLPGRETWRIISTYDPYHELVVQYFRAGGGVRTLLLRSPCLSRAASFAADVSFLFKRLRAGLTFLI